MRQQKDIHYTMECRFFALVLTYLINVVSPQENNAYGNKWESFTDVVIPTDILSDVSNIRSDVECVSLCHMTEACVSVFYRPQHRRCQLHDVLFMSPQDGQEEAGTVYYSLTSGACPPGYIHNRLLNFCYQIQLNKIARAEGIAHCGSRGQHFVTIDNQEKQNHFAKQVTASTDSKRYSYYIDGSDAATEGQWLHHDGRPMTYFAGAPSFPENSSESSDYLAASRNYEFRWQDRDSRERKYYACEKDI